MKLLQKILNKFNGLHYRQEYLCLAAETFQQPLRTYLVHSNKVLKDITNHHAFVGYHPVVFVFPAMQEFKSATIEIIFSEKDLATNETVANNKIATLYLKRIKEQAVDGVHLFYFESVHGRHRFLSGFHQAVAQLNNNLFGRKPGNVFLEGNLYKQVQIAYAVPRKISLITVGANDLYNHFPTDLHGEVGNDFYVISLRHAGEACKQVEAAKSIVLSDMMASSYKQVYALGKNHMQPLKEISAFNFSPDFSSNFRLPLPVNRVGYKELRLQESFTHGIHKLLLFKIIHSETSSEANATLVHINNAYATWRYKKGLPSNYLLR